MTLKRKQLGDKGELLAKDYLIQKGYKILTTNYRTKFGEIDIIGEIDEFIVFFEVRSKSTLNFGSAEESINKAKQLKVKRVAQNFILQEKALKKAPRFDAITIIFDNNQEMIKLNHYKNAF